MGIENLVPLDIHLHDILVGRHYHRPPFLDQAHGILIPDQLYPIFRDITPLHQPHHLRHLQQAHSLEHHTACHLVPSLETQLTQQHPAVEVTDDYQKIQIQGTCLRPCHDGNQKSQNSLL